MRVLGLVVALLAAPVMACSATSWDWGAGIDRAILDESLVLGTEFLLNNQKPEGNFNYEYDWKTRKQNPDDNQVRQVGAMWGLALIYHSERDPRVAEALERSIKYFAIHSVVQLNGARYIVYPGTKKGQTGCTALAVLTLVDYLRADPPHLTDQQRASYQGLLDEYLAHLIWLRKENGRWHDSYNQGDGSPQGNSSNPYVDGEALLALIKAAKYAGHEELRDLILHSAEAGYWNNVVLARALHPDSSTTKGYYQWSSMAFFEIATTGWPGTEKLAPRVIELADWMIDTHHTLRRQRNTAYAYEGIIHAYELARRAGDEEHIFKLGHVIDAGLGKITSWQVGGPTANAYIREHPTDDPLAIGGIQNHRSEAPLRIDVTQHQMHAVILARRYRFPK
jgi:UDP-N-acetylmuramoyl-tripeptide--D-alanyl-D-alanine ligase